jgi:hypothetical protein
VIHTRKLNVSQWLWAANPASVLTNTGRSGRLRLGQDGLITAAAQVTDAGTDSILPWDATGFNLCYNHSHHSGFWGHEKIGIFGLPRTQCGLVGVGEVK